MLTRTSRFKFGELVKTIIFFRWLSPASFRHSQSRRRRVRNAETAESAARRISAGIEKGGYRDPSAFEKDVKRFCNAQGEEAELLKEAMQHLAVESEEARHRTSGLLALARRLGQSENDQICAMAKHMQTEIQKADQNLNTCINEGFRTVGEQRRGA